MMAHSNGRVFNLPCDVHFLGWRSDTFRLQQAGWELCVEQHPWEGRIRLGLRHGGLKVYALSEEATYHISQDYGREKLPTFIVNQFYTDIEKTLLFDISDFYGIDAKPCYVTRESLTIEDHQQLFIKPLVRTKEILVEPATVNALMEQIMKLQSPKLEEIRKRNRTREYIGNQETFHAQVISIAV